MPSSKSQLRLICMAMPLYVSKMLQVIRPAQNLSRELLQHLMLLFLISNFVSMARVISGVLLAKLKDNIKLIVDGL